jgi:hypothetical protein
MVCIREEFEEGIYCNFEIYLYWEGCMRIWVPTQHFHQEEENREISNWYALLTMENVSTCR